MPSSIPSDSAPDDSAPVHGEAEGIPPASVPQPGPARLREAMPPGPGLHVVATPIGNLRDITLRALDTLAGCDEILAEDTRQTRKLLDAFGLKASLSPYHDHNAAERRPEVLARLRAGASIALVSDAGTPLVSDPGFKLVRDAAREGIRIIPVPGASAPLAGLVASGLPSDRFLFAGFAPPKPAARQRFLAELAPVRATLILFETGPRLPASLADMAGTLGASREAAIARELTKLFEEIRRDSLGALAAHYAVAGGPKGEIVVLIGPPAQEAPADADAWEAALCEALGTLPVKAAASVVADRFGLHRREVYQRALALRSGDARAGEAE